jgi:AcrR family transcriptional regulator/DNA-binding MarR family transcriptional regulator
MPGSKDSRSPIGADARFPRRGQASRRSGERVLLAEFQRSRMLRAAMEEVSERGRDGTSVANIVARARVSRKTFYECFDSREDCFGALFEESVARLAGVVAPAYATAGSWAERLRAALVALLELLESEPDLGALVLTQLIADASLQPQLCARVLERLRSAVEAGCAEPTRSRQEVSPLAAEMIVGGSLAVLHARLQARQRDLSGLVNELMWMIVLPYQGPAAAAKQRRRTPPSFTARPARSTRGPLDGLDMRMTYRTAKVLTAIAEQPDASNVELAAAVGVADQGQISKLLARMAGLGLIENAGAHTVGAANAWRLTPRGNEVDAALRRRLVAGGPRPSRRRRA